MFGKTVWVLYSNMDSVIAIFRTERKAIKQTYAMMEGYGGKVLEVRGVSPLMTEIDIEDNQGKTGTFILLRTDVL